MAECIDLFGPLVLLLARRILPRSADAEDAVQEVFVEIWKNAAKYDPSVASERAFVAMLARRRLIDRGRSEARRVIGVRAVEDDGLTLASRGRSSEVGAWSANRDEAARASEALRELSTEQQLTIRLAVIDGLSHQEIADRTGSPLGTVKTNLRRGLLRVRELLGVSTMEVAR